MKRCMTMALLAVVVPVAVAKAEEPYQRLSNSAFNTYGDIIDAACRD